MSESEVKSIISEILEENLFAIYTQIIDFKVCDRQIYVGTPEELTNAVYVAIKDHIKDNQ